MHRPHKNAGEFNNLGIRAFLLNDTLKVQAFDGKKNWQVMGYFTKTERVVLERYNDKTLNQRTLNQVGCTLFELIHKTPENNFKGQDKSLIRRILKNIF
jgi:hypothetical protein